MKTDRNWTVLLIGGASGTGKSSLAYQIARFYGVNVLEVDDVHQMIKAVTTKTDFPAIHHWETGVDWQEIGVQSNVQWLRDVGKEMLPALTALVERHLEDRLPIIIEGDFIHPELAASFTNSEVKALFVLENKQQQLVENYTAREGGAPQQYRAEISVAYGGWLADACQYKGICTMNARPWDTALDRAVACLHT